MSDVEKKNAKLQKLEKKNVWLNEKEKLIVSLVEIMVIEATVGTKQRTYKTKRKAKCRKSKQRQKLSNSNTQGNRAHQTPPSSPAAQRINGQEGQKEEGIRSPPNSAISPTSRIDCIQTDHSHAS